MKQTIKQKKETAERAALLRRVTDVYSGALGQQWTADDFATAEILERAVYALRGMFAGDEGDYRFGLHVLGHYDTPAKAADFLFEHGIRAGRAA